MENMDKSEISKNIIRIIRGSVISIIVSLILLLIFAIILTYTSIQENTINPVIIIISGVSILIGSGISTLKIKKNGLLNGSLVGLIYIITLYILSSITGAGFSANMYSAIMMLVCVITGMIGGVIGVNIQ